MHNVVLSPISTETLIERIAERTAEIISQKNVPQPEQKTLLSRAETAELLQVNLATVHRWSVAKKLNPKGIGGRVYYDREEVLNSVKSLK